MKVSEWGAALIRRFEGLELEAYQDIVGVWTIGYGHTKGVKKGDKITERYAKKLLREDLDYFAGRVRALLTREPKQHQFDAMVSLAYNVGAGAFSRSTLRRKFNEGDTAGAAREFKRWVHAGGLKLPGLVRRREAEKELFLGPNRKRKAKKR